MASPGQCSKYSKYEHQYRHDILARGICIEQCEQLVGNLSDKQREQFLQPKFDIQFKYIINDWLLPGIERYRQRYGDLANICLNYRTQLQYNLSVYSEIEYCTTNETLIRATDFWDIAFYAVLVMLFLLAVAASIYDGVLAKNSDHNHYRSLLESKSQNLLTAFSLRRNINRLTIKLDNDPIQKSLRFLEFVRVLVMTTITIDHVIIGMSFTTIQNPEFTEKIGSIPMVQAILTLMPFQVDVFFAISGLLVAVQFVKVTNGKPFAGKMFWLGLVNRYLRSLPVYLVVLLHSVSVYDLLESPSAYRIVATRRIMCRAKWWINLLFINNYYQPEEQCLIQTWYLAADFQLFIVGFGSLMVLWRYPKLLKPMFCTLLTAGFILPMLNVGYHSTSGIYFLSNKACSFQLWYDKWFTKTYVAMETHCLSYFAGMLVGIIYHKMQKNDLLLEKSRLFKPLRYSVFPILLAFSLSNPFFQTNTDDNPSLGTILYSGFQRLSFAAFVTVGFLVLMFANRNTFFGTLRTSQLLENSLLRVLSRLSFSFYLIHMTVLKTIYANLHEAERGTALLAFQVLSSATAITYFLSLLAFLLVEKPFDIIFKQLLEGGRPRKPPILSPNNSNEVNVTIQRNGHSLSNGK
ncbi:conserved hypothetical protein [Culex quinquefasciatus]|uniref:Acyltransferase 3 domain-containing protein n=1 Tax=Culex quinquefasciatus TaxID=7176 RepID=B0WNY2_CULQU|nr:conserved hypothetical protein [Culex quinquefasciatus]|eukprot:XP_001850416.1 conserved hypothetical protein [Culex quinquefasciatus]